MRKDWELTEQAFGRISDWLHPDRQEAGQKYEEIRRHLIIILTCRGCTEAEELADETINRVIRRSQEMADTYIGEPAPYFITVAHNVFREYLAKRRPTAELPQDLPQPPGPDEDEGREYDCLEQCVQELRPANRDLVLQYQGEQAGQDRSSKETGRRDGHWYQCFANTGPSHSDHSSTMR
jgi:DNA-directed RNA polymerase specialized sigma24 family protein